MASFSGGAQRRPENLSQERVWYEIVLHAMLGSSPSMTRYGAPRQT
jgi:hypothetical protein